MMLTFSRAHDIVCEFMWFREIQNFDFSNIRYVKDKRLLVTSFFLLVTNCVFLVISYSPVTRHLLSVTLYCSFVRLIR